MKYTTLHGQRSFQVHKKKRHRRWLLADFPNFADSDDSHDSADQHWYPQMIRPQGYRMSHTSRPNWVSGSWILSELCHCICFFAYYLLTSHEKRYYTFISNEIWLPTFLCRERRLRTFLIYRKRGLRAFLYVARNVSAHFAQRIFGRQTLLSGKF